MGVSVAIGVGIGAVVGGTAAAIQSGGDFNAIWKGALVGAVGGAVGGWAAPALTGALGGTLGGMAAGGLGGLTSGVLGTALNGGNASDYLQNGLFGAIGGAATGGLTGAAGALGGEAGVNPVTGEAVPTGAPEITAMPDVNAPTGMSGNVNAAEAVNTSVTGNAPSTTPEFTTPQLDTGTPANTQYAANNTGTMTDIGGSSAVPQELPGGYQAPQTTTASPDQFKSFVNSGNTNSQTGLSAFDLAGANSGEGQTLAPVENTSMPTQVGNESPTGWNLGDVLKKTGQGVAGKMLNMGNLLKGAGAVQGYGEAKQNRQQLMDLYNTQMGQYNTQNAAANQYQQQLQNTYNNPNAYLNSPEAEATRQQAMQKLLAQNAAAGRRSAGLAMQNQLMQNQLANLSNYRTGLSNAARGAYASPTGLHQTLGAAQAQSPAGNLYAGLGSIFAPQPNYVIL